MRGLTRILSGLVGRRLGFRAEEIAAGVMVERGMILLGRNVRTRYGEIDLVALDGETLVFVEVKARQGRDAGSPAEAIDPRKQKKLAGLAEYYLLEHPEHGRRPCRFDAILLFPEEGKWRVEVIADAFRPGW